MTPIAPIKNPAFRFKLTWPTYPPPKIVSSVAGQYTNRLIYDAVVSSAWNDPLGQRWGINDGERAIGQAQHPRNGLGVGRHQAFEA